MDADPSYISFLTEDGTVKARNFQNLLIPTAGSLGFRINLRDTSQFCGP